MNAWKQFASLAALLALAGCGDRLTGGNAVRPKLPALPASLSQPCADPGVRVGRTVEGEFARNRQALAACKRKQRDTVTFYNNARSRLGGVDR